MPLTDTTNGCGATMTADLPPDAVEAAAQAMDRMPPNNGKNIRPWEDFARAALSAALPALREALAQELEEAQEVLLDSGYTEEWQKIARFCFEGDRNVVRGATDAAPAEDGGEA